jgi:muramoyltetrapeptide carboxypeptidase LdcA involved in peptidoglycan recycling
MQNTLKSANFVHNNPKKRAEDLMNALKNKYIKAIFSTI